MFGHYHIIILKLSNHIKIDSSLLVEYAVTSVTAGFDLDTGFENLSVGGLLIGLRDAQSIVECSLGCLAEPSQAKLAATSSISISFMFCPLT